MSCCSFRYRSCFLLYINTTKIVKAAKSTTKSNAIKKISFISEGKDFIFYPLSYIYVKQYKINHRIQY
ncbi:protein of unknown function [Chryseobacterium sp. JV274]|nr:protein of unknown function [Chryseobacterium sp. JV274]